tara:strand:+ start:107 stop:517 length:411 start_codon:yes stop_codon:yes gene_type:complete
MSDSEYFYGQFTAEHFEKMKKGLHLFNEQMYWECHEELEHHWLEDSGDNARLIYWAVIQVAAAMYHYRDENLVGVHGLLAKAKDKLDRAKKHKVETDYLLENLNWDEFKKMTLEAPVSENLSHYQHIYDFRFRGNL